MQELLLQLGNPHERYPTIHVAGTNGKGSTTTKIASVLMKSGYKVGVYTSPHISSFRERIRVNEEMIGENEVVAMLPAILEHGDEATFFEYTTALAFAYFAAAKVDIAVIETGLGGRLDATNVITPILSVITSIEFDHTAILGTTLEAIACEKAGIIKQGVPLVIGPHVPRDIIEPYARKAQSPLFQVTQTPDSYEEENCLIAKQSIDVISNKYKIPAEAIKKGLASLPPCRFERVDDERLQKRFGHTPLAVILDVAHNPDGIRRLFSRVRATYSGPIHVVYGSCSDKDYGACLEYISQIAEMITCVQGSVARAQAPNELTAHVKGITAYAADSLSEGLEHAYAQACHKRATLIVTGTFYIMSEARRFFGYNEAQDEVML